MFDRYTEAARLAMFFARYAVSQHGGEAIEPEHLLLGLFPPLSVDDLGAEDLAALAALQTATTAAHILQTAAITHETVESRIKRRALPLATSVEIPFSASTKRCLEDAEREASQMGSRPITTRHLLLGLLQADGTDAAGILHDGGLRLSEVRLRVEADVSAGVEGNPPRTPSNEELA